MRRRPILLRATALSLLLVSLLFTNACGSEPDGRGDRTSESGSAEAGGPEATPLPTTPPVPAAAALTPDPPTAVPEPPTAAPEPTAAPDPTAAPIEPPAAAECRLEPSPPGPAGVTELEVEVVAEGLEVPWGIAVLPDGDLLITERPGRVRLIEDGVLVADPVLEPKVELPPPLFGVDGLGPEGGLLGVVLHPDFEENRQFYLFTNLVNDAGDFIGRVDRHVLSADGRSATFDRVILDDLPAGVHHQGGRMHIGPDGMLHVAVGAFEPWEAQNPDILAGKLLRLDLDGGVPPDNPDPDSYVYVSGIRNSQGFDWLDDDTLVVVDHGPSGLELGRPDLRGFDEVNVVRGGDNLGWPRIWGCDRADGLVSPVLTWESSVPPTGGLVYRDTAIPGWQGSFLFTTVGRDFGRHLHRVELAPEPPHDVVSHEVYLFREHGRLRTIAAAPDGGIYVMTSNCDGRGECPARGDLVLHVRAAAG